MTARTRFLAASCALLLGGCQTAPPLDAVDYVDLERFMGDWYVIANIPTFVEKGAHNAVESYRLDDDGTIATTFSFRKGGFDGEKKTYRPRGFVVDRDSNAIWSMQFIWPIKGDYRVIYLDEEYTVTVIGREKRDYVWLMAREPELGPGDYERAFDAIERAGYDIELLQHVPQRW